MSPASSEGCFPTRVAKEARAHASVKACHDKVWEGAIPHFPKCSSHKTQRPSSLEHSISSWLSFALETMKQSKVSSWPNILLMLAVVHSRAPSIYYLCLIYQKGNSMQRKEVNSQEMAAVSLFINPQSLNNPSTLPHPLKHTSTILVENGVVCFLNVGNDTDIVNRTLVKTMICIFCIPKCVTGWWLRE